MCKRRNSAWVRIGKRGFRVDACIRDLIRGLNFHDIETVASCCGHGKYPVTIVHRAKEPHIKGFLYDLGSGYRVSRKSKFYVKDKEGLFFIPEVMENNKQKFA